MQIVDYIVDILDRTTDIVVYIMNVMDYVMEIKVQWFTFINILVISIDRKIIHQWLNCKIKLLALLFPVSAHRYLELFSFHGRRTTSFSAEALYSKQMTAYLALPKIFT